MSIEEIIEQAKQKGDGLKFKAKEGQSINSEVVFEVVDAYFGFLTYPKLNGGFFRVSDLKQMSNTPLEFELVE